jgi:hypothetical protein
LTLNVYDIAVPLAGNYWVAAGGVFQGVLTGFSPGTVSWRPNVNDSSRPFNPSGTACKALAQFNPGTGLVLYGGFVSSNGTASLYQSDSTYSFGTGYGTPITMAVPGEQVTYLKAAGPTYLFMGGATLNSGSNQYQFELDYSSNGTQWFQTNLTTLPYPITGVGYDSFSNTYWAVSSPFGLNSTSISTPATIYTSPGPTPTSFSPVSNPSGDMVNGILVDSANRRVFLATRLHGIYWSQSGGAWNQIGADQQGSVTVSSLCVAGPVDSPGGVVYLVGSDGYGYYTLNTSTNSMSRFGDSTILLYTSSVSRIAVDNLYPQENVLMGTNVNGLWRGTFDGTGNLASGQSWVHE